MALNVFVNRVVRQVNEMTTWKGVKLRDEKGGEW